MSTLKADTIQSTSGGAVTLTKQSAATTRLTYDQPASTMIDSLNISTASDESDGLVLSTFTNAYSSATQRQVMVSAWNTDNGGSGSVASNARGLNAYQATSNNTVSTVKTFTAYGSTASSDGQAADVDGHYVAIFGDLA